VTHPLFDIAGRTALVTGSTRGIGLGLAEGLADAGCTLVLHGRDPVRLEDVRADLADRTGATVLAVDFDVTDPAAVVTGVAAAEELAGPLDILVNNVGAQHRAPLLEFADEDWYRLVNTNLSSAFFVGREAARRMAPRGAGRIVNIVSLQSEVARPGIAPYAATKAALKMLTKGMCADLAPLGINVNAVGPGYIKTELTADLVNDPDFDTWIRGRTPAGRWGEVSDLVGAVLFLCSPAADFINGQTLYVDGGMLAVL
jgi:gluconate 5-dehydrogenase